VVRHLPYEQEAEWSAGWTKARAKYSLLCSVKFKNTILDVGGYQQVSAMHIAQGWPALSEHLEH